MKSMQSAANTFPLLDENGLDDELFKKKLAYPYEYLNLSNTLLRSLHLNTASILCTVTLYLVIHGKLV